MIAKLTQNRCEIGEFYFCVQGPDYTQSLQLTYNW